VIKVVNPNLNVKTDGIIRVKTEDDFASKAIIVALGSQFRKLGLSGADTFVVKRVCCCVTSNDPIFKDKAAGMKGSGNAAITEALYLCKSAPSFEVTLRHSQL